MYLTWRSWECIIAWLEDKIQIVNTQYHPASVWNSHQPAPFLHPNSTKSKKEYQESKNPCVVLNDIIGNDQKLIKGMFGKKGDGGRGE